MYHDRKVKGYEASIRVMVWNVFVHSVLINDYENWVYVGIY